MRIDERVRTALAATTRFADIRLLDTVGSTNAVVRDAALAGAPEGLVVAADHQTAGRGRMGRSWEAPAGTGLLVSILLRPGDLGPGRLHLVTAAVALSAAAAVTRVAGVTPEVKWPNDLLIEDRKLAGILAEGIAVAPGGQVGAIVVGIGLNVSAAPDGAISVEAASGRTVDRAELLAVLLEELEGRYGRWDTVAAEYRTSCSTVGHRVRVEAPAGTFRTGRATGLDADGRLLVVDGETGTEVAFSVGDVVHLRTAAGPDPA